MLYRIVLHVIFRGVCALWFKIMIAALVIPVRCGRTAGISPVKLIKANRCTKLDFLPELGLGTTLLILF